MHILINDAMAALGIPYEPVEWTGENPPEVYFTSEFRGASTTGEDGETHCDIILIGHCRGTYSSLLKCKDNLERFFKLGVTASRPRESVRIKFDYWHDVPTGVEGFKRIEIYLTAKKWREY